MDLLAELYGTRCRMEAAVDLQLMIDRMRYTAADHVGFNLALIPAIGRCP